MSSKAVLHDPCPSVRYRALENLIRSSRDSDSQRGNSTVETSSSQKQRVKMLSDIRHCVLRDSDPACRAKAMEALSIISVLGDVECVELAMVRAMLVF